MAELNKTLEPGELTSIAAIQRGNRWRRGLLLLVLLLIGGCAALGVGALASDDDDDGGEVATAIDPADVVADVRAALAADGFGGIDVSGVEPDVTIVLEGEVPTEADRDDAERIALGVAGVVGVDNRLVVAADEPDPEPADLADPSLVIDTGDLTGEIIVTGTVADRDLADAIIAQLSDAFSPLPVIDELDIDDATALDGGTVTILGDAPDTESAESVRGSLGVLADQLGADIDDQLTISGNSGEEQAFEDSLNELAELEPITFAVGSAELTAEGQATVEKAAAIFAANPDVPVRVDGHTDDTGNRDSNIRLSQARAESVLAALVELGVDEGRLTAAGFGPDQPAVPNDSNENRARNRRIEFTVNP